jgi:glucan biosynthesis protein C
VRSAAYSGTHHSQHYDAAMSQTNNTHHSAARQLASDNTRLYFLDWVRILAFFLLIFYHVGMYYVTWGWHVKSASASTTIEPLMMLTSPWRLSLLFLISGVASRFMLNKFKPSQFLRQRSWRLLVPLIFGMLVIVPPQTYCEVIEKLSYSGSYLDFMKLYLSAYHGFCKDGSCLILPTWNHLWFLAYLWCYTILLTGVMFLSRARFDVAAQSIASWLSGWKLIAIPLALLALMRLILFSLFPDTHALVDDWYNHAHYFFLFLLGAMLAPQRKVWMDMESMRWASLALALFCWALLTIYFALPENYFTDSQFEFWRNVQRVVYACCEWNAIIAVCGFAHRHLQFDSSLRRYLTQAVFPFYLLHQTIIVVVAHAIKPANLAAPIESVVIIILTFTLCFGAFEIVRRMPLLRPLFGVGRQEDERSLRQNDKPLMA